MPKGTTSAAMAPNVHFKAGMASNKHGKINTGQVLEAMVNHVKELEVSP